MNETVLMSDPRVAAIPVTECGERLVDVRREGSILLDTRKQDPVDAYAHLREGVLQRLVEAQSMLPQGLRLLFVEGYRPPALQRTYFEEYAAELRAAHPDWPADRIHSAASRYVSPPDIAPHSAGAAVDLTLADLSGRELDLGTRLNASPEDSDGACYTDADNISREARANRAVLGSVLTAAGLVNYPTEWCSLSSSCVQNLVMNNRSLEGLPVGQKTVVEPGRAGTSGGQPSTGWSGTTHPEPLPIPSRTDVVPPANY